MRSSTRAGAGAGASGIGASTCAAAGAAAAAAVARARTSRSCADLERLFFAGMVRNLNHRGRLRCPGTPGTREKILRATAEQLVHRRSAIKKARGGDGERRSVRQPAVRAGHGERGYVAAVRFSVLLSRAHLRGSMLSACAQSINWWALGRRAIARRSGPRGDGQRGL